MKKQYEEPTFRRIGLFKKYSVTRVDGKPVTVPCFVIELRPKKAVWLALEAYAREVSVEDPELARDLMQKAAHLKDAILGGPKDE